MKPAPRSTTLADSAYHANDFGSVRPIDTSEIVVVNGYSTIEFDLKKTGLAIGQLLEFYKANGEDIGRKLRSHDSILKSRSKLEQFLDSSKFVWTGELEDEATKQLVSNSPLVISLRGDDDFKRVSHYIGNNLLMGITADTTRSRGALNYFTAHNFEGTLTRLQKGDFSVEEWIRLETVLNGARLPPAVSEIYLGEDRRIMMSHYSISLSGRTERHDSSGLIVATGAGSTGWYDNEVGIVFPDGNTVPKNEIFARYITTGARPKSTGYKMTEGKLSKGEELEVTSYNKHSGILSVDCVSDVPFPRGSVARIRISDSPLKVVRMAA